MQVPTSHDVSGLCINLVDPVHLILISGCNIGGDDRCNLRSDVDILRVAARRGIHQWLGKDLFLHLACTSATGPARSVRLEQEAHGPSVVVSQQLLSPQNSELGRLDNGRIHVVISRLKISKSMQGEQGRCTYG